MPSKSKEKGNANELVVASMLSKWRESEFRRMPTSGALRWNGAAFTYGDIYGPEDFPFVVECKHYSEVDIDTIIRKDPNQSLISWWFYYQTIPDCIRCFAETGIPLSPMLVWKMNNRPHRVCILQKVFQDLVDHGGIALLGSRHIQAFIPNRPSFVMLDFREFLRNLTPTTMKRVMPWKGRTYVTTAN